MVRRLAPVMVFLAASVPPMAYAQVNIDESKTPAQIYESDCAVCHKSIRGLANGRGNSSLTEFLSEHYTSSGGEAAALAAYVLAGGGGVGTPAGQKPDQAAAGEPKGHDTRRPAKPQQPAANTKPPPAGEPGKPGEERSAAVEPGRAASERKPPPDRHGANAATHPNGRVKPAGGAPSTVAAVPSVAEPPRPDLTPPALAAPVDKPPPEASPASPPAEVSPGPPDNIPD